MRIGLTYDLRDEYLAQGYTHEETAEFDKQETIDAIDATVQSLGHDVERIGNARNLMRRLALGDRWDLVFNIAEGLNGYGREALVPALLDAHGIPYTFSDPLVMSLTLHKGMTKRVVRDAGVPTADFIVAEDARRIADIPFDPPYFIKPVAEGTGKGVTAASVVRDPDLLLPRCAELIAAFRQPVLVEAFLPGREFTVGIVGTGADASVLGTIEVRLLDAAEPGAYSYTNKENYLDLVEYKEISGQADPAVREAEAVSLKAWRVLGCRDGGRIDVRCDALGAPRFIEVNPLAGLHPVHSDLPILCRRIGVSYTELIARILGSALGRLAEDAGNGRTRVVASAV